MQSGKNLILYRFSSCNFNKRGIWCKGVTHGDNDVGITLRGCIEALQFSRYFITIKLKKWCCTCKEGIVQFFRWVLWRWLFPFFHFLFTAWKNAIGLHSLNSFRLWFFLDYFFELVSIPEILSVVWTWSVAWTWVYRVDMEIKTAKFLRLSQFPN